MSDNYDEAQRYIKQAKRHLEDAVDLIQDAQRLRSDAGQGEQLEYEIDRLLEVCGRRES